MGKVDSIIGQAKGLSREELLELQVRIDELAGEAWDRRTKSDVASGKLGQIATRAPREPEAGQKSPLPRARSGRYMPAMPTVWFSIVVAVGYIVFAEWMGLERAMEAVDPLVGYSLAVVLMVSVLRLTIFWFQTLIHGIRHVVEDNRVGLVLGHLFLGPIMSIGYYLNSRYEARHIAGSGDPGES